MVKLPVLSWKEVAKVLNKSKFVIKRQKGSHIVFVKEATKISAKRTVIVPKKKEIAIGTLKSIINQSRLSSEEFVELL